MKKRNKSTVCGNCNWTFKDANNYCPNCGQENHHFHAPLKEILHEFLESLFHFDAKVWLTLKTMVVSPGLISKHFFENKRQRYVPPFRFYIFISVIYFFLLNVIPEKQHVKLSTANESSFDLGKIKVSSEEKSLLVKYSDAQIDSFLVSKGSTNKASNFLYKIIIKIEEDKTIDDKMTKQFNKNYSFSMFLLMPLFAFILLWFYNRKEFFFSSFLTFSIHTHTAIFVLMIVDLIIKYFIQSDFVDLVLVLSMIMYMYFSFRTYFGKARLIFKTFFVLLIYSLFIIIVMALDGIIALFLI